MPILPDDNAVTAASVAGGLSGAFVNRSVEPWYRKLGETAVGAFCGIYGGPSVAALAGIHETRDIVAASFVVGVVGYGLVTIIVDYCKGANFREWVARFIGSKAPPAP